jgi:hypothetical protein
MGLLRFVQTFVTFESIVMVDRLLSADTRMIVTKIYSWSSLGDR